MKSNATFSYLFFGIVTSVLLTTSSVSFAGHADDTTRALNGTVACGGNHFRRLNGTERQFSAWTFRNFDDRLTILIDRIRIYDATGQLRADFPGTALPSFSNGDLGGTDNALEPHQTATLTTLDVFGDANFPRPERPLQMIVDWNANGRTLLLELSHARLARDRIVNPDTGEVRLGNERSRHQYDCRHIRIGRGLGFPGKATR
jgi:hypothetical protein